MALPKSETFDDLFLRLTDHAPFPWQRNLFAEFLQKQFRKTCDVPTGLGKTSIIAIWLLALVHHARTDTLNDFPRRLIYIVNRRTVVDQATREAERIRRAIVSEPTLADIASGLRSPINRASDAPFAISTLRGQFADNAEWRIDPARPAIIVGTVDMIGSRLLFAGYGRGFKTRPLHAGFLGQDSILIHDEAHLEPAFQELLTTIEREQKRCGDFLPLHLMALTATPRTGDSSESSVLTDEDRKHPIVSKRLTAKKGISFFRVEDEKATADEVVRHALDYRDSKQAIIVFLRKLDDVETAARKLRAEKLNVLELTGTMRGLERDEMVRENRIFARFMRGSAAAPEPGTVYLICTSAGEVGVDISADHMVGDLSPFDSMAQRLGRVNRFGDGDARVDVVYAEPAEDPRPLDEALVRTLSLLLRLPKRKDQRHDVSPAALGSLPLSERQDASTPGPQILPATDILFDAWALTSVRDKLPGRPAVAEWLHGIAEWEPPETYVAWREEVDLVTGDLLLSYQPRDLLEDYPVKPHELLRDRSDRIFKGLCELASRHDQSPIWIASDFDSVKIITLGELAQEKDARVISNRTLLLPPSIGGLTESGMLDGRAAFDGTRRYDVADRWNDDNDNPRRARRWDDDRRPDGMRLVRTIDLRPEADEEADEIEDEEASARRRYWRWYVRPRSADDDGSLSAIQRQELAPHLESAESFAAAIVERLGMRDPEALAVRCAAGWHDLGKDRSVWQRSIYNFDYPHPVLAKSGGKMRPQQLSGYRHEFGSLMDLSFGDRHRSEFFALVPEVQDLVLHLIAAHHGRARPHFPDDEVLDRNYTDADAAKVATETPRRFARLQRKYGRWGLAYLESLVRAADSLASQAKPSEDEPPPVVSTPRQNGEQ
jgi:CRISPR-associated endonuclease/helicase Cas3